MQHEAAPAAAHVEQALALPQSELLADQLALGQLGVLERCGPAREERAAVCHRGVEEQLEEVVAHVVVVAHGALVALAAVAGARAGAARWRGFAGGASGRTRAPRRASGARAWRGRSGVGERVEQGNHAVEVVGLELAGGVGAAEAQLPGARSRWATAVGERTVKTGPLGRSRGAPSRPRSAARRGAPGALRPARDATAQYGRTASSAWGARGACGGTNTGLGVWLAGHRVRLSASGVAPSSLRLSRAMLASLPVGLT